MEIDSIVTIGEWANVKLNKMLFKLKQQKILWGL